MDVAGLGLRPSSQSTHNNDESSYLDFDNGIDSDIELDQNQSPKTSATVVPGPSQECPDPGSKSSEVQPQKQPSTNSEDAKKAPESVNVSASPPQT